MVAFKQTMRPSKWSPNQASWRRRLVRRNVPFREWCGDHRSKSVIVHPHLLVRATNERFLPARATFRSVLASESHWLQQVLVLTIRWWRAPVSVGGLSTMVLLPLKSWSHQFHGHMTLAIYKIQETHECDRNVDQSCYAKVNTGVALHLWWIINQNVKSGLNV